MSVSGRTGAGRVYYIHNPKITRFFIAINKVDPQKKQALKKNFDQYGVYTTAIQCPYNYWAIGTLLGLDNNQFCRATLDHLYIEKKDQKPAPLLLNFYSRLEMLITKYNEGLCKKDEIVSFIEQH